MQGHFPEPLPEPLGFRIALFELSKPVPAQVIVVGVFIGFGVDLNVVLLQGVDRVLLHLCFVPPHFVGGHQLPKLGPPVTKVVDPYRYVVDLSQDVGNGVPDHG